MVRLSSVLTLLASVATLTAAHPEGGDGTHAIAGRRLFAENAMASFSACQDSEHLRDFEDRVSARRLETVKALREKQRRRRLDAATVLAKSHLSTLTDVSVSTDAKTLFGATPKCVLQPQMGHGPFYVKGELVRKDVREDQAGIDLYTELQVIDVNTCKPVEKMYIDFWHCNATGVYSGVVAKGNGDFKDKSNWNTTFGRGLAPTDADGVVRFVSKFPGHYAGRATHIHVLGSHGGQLLPNGTYVSTNATSIGRLFFDQELISKVEATSVYAANKVAITPNSADKLFADASATDFDPVVQYVYLGDNVEDGIFAWISIGVDMSANMPVNPVAAWTKTGGVATANANAKPGKGEHGGPGGHGGMPGPATGSNNTSTDSDDSQDNDTTDDMIPGGRNPLFSVAFFFLSSGALVFLLRKYPVRPQPQRNYGALESA